MYICVYVCINRFSDKERQLFWNLKVSYRFIDNLEPTNSNLKLLLCYGILLTSLNLTFTKVKNTPQSCDDSAYQRMLQKPPHLKCEIGQGHVCICMYMYIYGNMYTETSKVSLK